MFQLYAIEICRKRSFSFTNIVEIVVFYVEYNLCELAVVYQFLCIVLDISELKCVKYDCYTEAVLILQRSISSRS